MHNLKLSGIKIEINMQSKEKFNTYGLYTGIIYTVTSYYVFDIKYTILFFIWYNVIR